MNLFRTWLSKRKPVFFENSKVPVWFSKILPVEVNTVDVLCFVFCANEVSKTSARHKTIHYMQRLETLFVLRLLLYSLYFLRGLILTRSFRASFDQNPFEREALENQRKTTYLSKRPLWNWKNYR